MSTDRALGLGKAETAGSDQHCWAVHLQPCGALLVERTTLFYARLSGRGAELALYLASTGSAAGTADVLAHVYGEPQPDSPESIRRALATHPASQRWEELLAGQPVRITGSPDAYVPLQCSLQLTNACNLRCSFCYASSGRPFANELGLDDWLHVMQRLATAGVAAVTLTGGEPTVARGFTPILGAAGALFTSVDVFTNGMSWSDENIALARSLGNVRCQVSVDGLAQRHDEVRGRRGSFAAALRTIDRLATAGLTVVVSMTVMRENASDVLALSRELDRAGASYFRVGTIVPVGRGADRDFGLTDDQLRDVERQLHRARDEASRLEVQGWDACGDPVDELRSIGPAFDFCVPGYLNWHILADGRVTPCQVEGRSFGHVLRDSITDIGAPDRLARVRSCAKSCECIKHVELPDEGDLPFSAGGGESSVPRQSTPC